MLKSRITLKMIAASTRCCLSDSLGCTHFETHFCYKSTFFSRFYYPLSIEQTTHAGTRARQAPVTRHWHRVLKQLNKPHFPALPTSGASLHPPTHPICTATTAFEVLQRAPRHKALHGVVLIQLIRELVAAEGDVWADQAVSAACSENETKSCSCCDAASGWPFNWVWSEGALAVGSLRWPNDDKVFAQSSRRSGCERGARGLQRRWGRVVNGLGCDNTPGIDFWLLLQGRRRMSVSWHGVLKPSPFYDAVVVLLQMF
jgi:hypothetical protein